MSVVSSDGLSVASLKPLTPPASRKLEGHDLERFREMAKLAEESAHPRPMGRTGHGDYAQVMVGGKAVATLSNEGFATMSNALGAQLGQALTNDGDGPALAQRRAEQIAQALGGTVVKLNSAMTQAQWQQRPADGNPEDSRRASACSIFNAQMIGGADSDA